MRIYNQPPSPPAKTSVITPPKATGKSSSKPSALQERMMKYQQVVAKSSEEGIHNSSLRSSIDKPTLHIDIKERMAAWGHKDVEEDESPPEDIIQEKEREVEAEPLSLAERMAKYREESSPDKFEKKRAKEEETEKLMKLREEEDKLQKMKEEEERKFNANKVLRVNPRRASNAIKERMKAWGYNPEEEEEEVPETKVESEGEDAPPTNENVCDTSEPESPKHTREVSTKLKERMNAFDNMNIVDEVAIVVGEVSEPAAESKSPTHVREVSSNLKERMSAFSNTGDANNDETTLSKQPIQISEVAPNILEEKMKAYKRAGSSSRELKPTPPTDLPPRELTSSLLKEKLNVWEHGVSSSELEGENNQDHHIKENELAHMICSNLLKEKMNAYKEAGTSQQAKIASPIDFPSSELTGNLLKERSVAWENGPSTKVEGNMHAQ